MEKEVSIDLAVSRACLYMRLKPHILSVLQLFMWEWSKGGALPSEFAEGAEHAWSPVVVHKTRRSLRAVHFHPHGAPLMLTAEVACSPRAFPDVRPRTHPLRTCIAWNGYDFA